MEYCPKCGDFRCTPGWDFVDGRARHVSYEVKGVKKECGWVNPVAPVESAGVDKPGGRRDGP